MMATSRVWVGFVLMLPLLLAGCKGFWDPIGSSFTLSNSGTISVSPGATSGNTSTITITPASSFSGTVDLSCAVTTSPSDATSPVTCSLSPTSVTVSSSTTQTATLTASSTSTTTTGSYEITVTGTSGSASTTATACVIVGTSSGSCSSASTSTSGNFYVLNNTSITGYSIDAGSVTAISNGSFSNLADAAAVAIAPTGSSLYVASTSGISLYAVNTNTGALSQANASFSDPAAEAIAVDPSGKWLLDASGTGTLYAFPITSSGTPDSSRSVQNLALAGTGVQPGGIAISPNGALLVVALGSTGTEAFPFTASSNSPIGSPYSNILTPYGKSASSAAAAVAVAIDPQSRLLYVGETAAFPSSTANSGALRVFTIGTNSLTEFPYTSPYAPGGTGPHAILPISTGDYVYVASWQSGTSGLITAYSVATSALTPLTNTYPTGTQPFALAEDSSSSFLLAVSNSGTTLFAYTINGTTGQLSSPISDSPVSGPIGVVAAP